MAGDGGRPDPTYQSSEMKFALVPIFNYYTIHKVCTIHGIWFELKSWMFTWLSFGVKKDCRLGSACNPWPSLILRQIRQANVCAPQIETCWHAAVDSKRCNHKCVLLTPLDFPRLVQCLKRKACTRLVGMWSRYSATTAITAILGRNPAKERLVKNLVRPCQPDHNHGCTHQWKHQLHANQSWVD
jgi:hypothetical protein